LRREKSEGIPAVERRRERFFSLLDQHLEAVYNFSYREIAYHGRLSLQ
jgi:hypothetical protein